MFLGYIFQKTLCGRIPTISIDQPVSYMFGLAVSTSGGSANMDELLAVTVSSGGHD